MTILAGNIGEDKKSHHGCMQNGRMKSLHEKTMTAGQQADDRQTDGRTGKATCRGTGFRSAKKFA